MDKDALHLLVQMSLYFNNATFSVFFFLIHLTYLFKRITTDYVGLHLNKHYVIFDCSDLFNA